MCPLHAEPTLCNLVIEDQKTVAFQICLYLIPSPVVQDQHTLCSHWARRHLRLPLPQPLPCCSCLPTPPCACSVQLEGQKTSACNPALPGPLLCCLVALLPCCSMALLLKPSLPLVHAVCG